MVTSIHTSDFQSLCARLSASEVEQLKGQLDRGETIYWAACPNTWRYLMGRYACSYSNAMGIFFFGVVFTILGIGAGLMSGAWSGIVFAIPGLLMLTPALFEARRARQLLFAITDRRALILDIRQMKTSLSFGLDILEMAMNGETGKQLHEIPQVEFFGIDDAPAVRGLIRDVIQAHATRLAEDEELKSLSL